ncbi:MAG: hypothetical protein B7Z73_12900 [Planctomycetia bacterium 21-64-5]|nr:MAG: hypothetical protein B7Z73_12900 [Planctomycetia bacterium 21-64-5]HQU46879.1 hypothetical protein [Pirellulales bacterium]
MSSDEEPILVLTPPHRPWLGVCAGLSGLCIGVGFSMALLPVGHFLVWLAVGFAGVIGLACVGHLLPGNSALILTGDGFAIRFASRAAFYAWSEVDYFAVAERRLVAFRLLDTSQQVSPMARRLTGFDGALPARYGSLPVEQLADRLNECRERFVGPG